MRENEIVFIILVVVIHVIESVERTQRIYIFSGTLVCGGHFNKNATSLKPVVKREHTNKHHFLKCSHSSILRLKMFTKRVTSITEIPLYIVL